MVRMSTRTAICFWLALAVGAPSMARAQPAFNAPPIDPGQVFRAQPRPSTTLPPPQVTAPGAPRPPVVSRPVPQGRIVQDRATQCQHMAGVERVPKKKRGAYIHNCMQAD
jgi:hypothetical protein